MRRSTSSSRARFPISARLRRWRRGIVAPDGMLVAMKGALLGATKSTALPRDFTVIATPSLDVPGLDAKRHLVILRRAQGASR